MQKINVAEKINVVEKIYVAEKINVAEKYLWRKNICGGKIFVAENGGKNMAKKISRFIMLCYGIYEIDQIANKYPIKRTKKN